MRFALSAVLLSPFLLPIAPAQTPAPTTPCAIQLPPLTAPPGRNLFNDRQEQDLGDILAEYVESDLRIAPPSPDDQLTRIGQQLLDALPPSGVHYTFRIFESRGIDAFSIPGGHIYVSRKLITAIHNQDELAGVLAHEIGHIATHQSVMELSLALQRMGVSQLGDRADIAARLHQLFNSPLKLREPGNQEEKDQLAADHVAIYAVVRAGYSPESFASFLDAIMANKGKTGNWLTDAFGLTHEDSRRYRTALKIIDTLPLVCRTHQPRQSEAFQAWLKHVVESHVSTAGTQVTGDQPVKLLPTLQPTLWHVQYSPDGRYALAQDGSSISVVDVNARKLLFQVDAPAANGAQFTPDSRELIFSDSGFRVERWNIQTAQRTFLKEMVVFDGCSTSMLSQDGNTLVCVRAQIDKTAKITVRLIDVQTGNVVFEKKLVELDLNVLPGWMAANRIERRLRSGGSPASVAISQGGRYAVFSFTDHVLACDLLKRQPIQLEGKLKHMDETRMAFLSENEFAMVGIDDSKYVLQRLSFPDGKLLSQLPIGRQTLAPVTKGGYLLVSPLKDYGSGLWNLKDSRLLAFSKFAAMDVYDDLVVAEGAMGNLSFGKVGASHMDDVDLGTRRLPGLQAASFSPDGKYLAASLPDRAGVWDLSTGKQIQPLRPFSSAWIDDKDKLVGAFPKYVNLDAAELEVQLPSMALRPLSAPEEDSWQFHDLELRLLPRKKDDESGHKMTFEVRNMRTQKVAWSREYPKERPACWAAEDDRLVLAWDLSSAAARQEIAAHPQLETQAALLKDRKKGLLLETVKADSGDVLQQVVLPETDLTQGRDDERRALVSGSYVIAHGEHGNTAIYALDGHGKIAEFFGRAIASDAAADIVIAENREGEVILVQESTGKELQRFNLGAPLRAAKVIQGAKKMLYILTADQVVHRIPLA